MLRRATAVLGGLRIHANWRSMSTPFPGIEKGIWESPHAKGAPLRFETEGELHLVFLEGGTGTGKATIIWKLQKLGYSIFSQPFVPFCLENPGYEPGSTFMNIKWANKLIETIDWVKSESDKGNVRDNIAFFDRSFLSPAAYTRSSPIAIAESFGHLMHETRTVYSTSMVLCHADPYSVQQRRAGRLFDAKEDEMAVRLALGENDDSFQSIVNDRYKMMDEAGLFDAVLDTSSSKLGVAALLHSLDVFPIDISKELEKMEEDKLTVSIPKDLKGLKIPGIEG